MRRMPLPRLGSLIKLTLMLLRGFIPSVQCGRGRGLAFVGKGVRLREQYKIFFEGRLVLEDFCEIQGFSENGVRFGRNVSVGCFASIRPSGYYGASPGVGLSVGDFSSIGPYCYIGCAGGVEIGSNVMLAPHVTIHSENHLFADLSRSIKSQGTERQTTTIGDNCWVATGARIMAGVTVGEGSVVAAGSVVTKNVPPFSVVGGVPARVLRSRADSALNDSISG